MKKRTDLQRLARLGGNDEKGFVQVEPACHAPDHHRIGGVQNLQPREARRAAEDVAEHFRRQARPAHAQKDNVVDAAVGEGLHGGADLADVGGRLHGRVQPSQPVGNLLRRRLPDMKVVGPDARGNIAAAHFIQRVIDVVLVGPQ